MKEQTFDRPVETPVPPNFDDELTLVSARRVVPLAKINAKLQNRRYWFLAGALVLSMLLGAGSALLAAYVRLRNVPNSVSEISEVEAPLAVAAPVVASELPATENPGGVANPEESATPVAPMKRANISPHPTVTRPRVVTQPMSEEDELNRIRDAVLIDQWQERRVRRATRRERRNRVDNHNRDLSNLDEIFEGPRQRPF